MSAHRGTDGHDRLYTLLCSRPGCPAYFNPPRTVRKASHARQLATGAGWYAPTSKKKRHRGDSDLCPDCRKNPR